MTADEKKLRALGFRLVDTSRCLAMWREGTMVRHSITGAVAHVKAHMFKGDVILTGVDGKRFDVYGDSTPQRDNWQTVEPLGAPDVPGVLVELKELEREISSLESQAQQLRSRVGEIRRRLGEEGP